MAKEPANDLYQFNLAVLRIRSPEPQKYEEALNTLERLRKVQGFRAGSLRALLADAVQRDELERADILAQELQMHPQVTFADYLLALDFYRKLDAKKFDAVLEKVKPVAARDPGDLARLMDWMNKNGMAAEVLKWSDKLAARDDQHAAAGYRGCGGVRGGEKLVAPETLDAQRRLGRFGISALRLPGLQFAADEAAGHRDGVRCALEISGPRGG